MQINTSLPDAAKQTIRRERARTGNFHLVTGWDRLHAQMKFERSDHHLGLMHRSVIMTLALLLLAAQSFSAAHYHQKDFRDNLTHAAQGADALCSLCLFHFHAPANAGAPPDIGEPSLAVSRLTPQAMARLHALAIARVFSRGPPFSL